MKVVKMITEGDKKGGVNEPPTTPRPPAPVGYGSYKRYTPKMTGNIFKPCPCGVTMPHTVTIQLCDDKGMPVDKYIAMKKEIYDKMMREVKS